MLFFSISHDTIISVLSLVYVFTIGQKRKRRRVTDEYKVRTYRHEDVPAATAIWNQVVEDGILSTKRPS